MLARSGDCAPRVPSSAEIESLLRRAAAELPLRQVWVNPDCGLKTRRTDEVESALANMVVAAKQVRERLG